MGIPVGIVTHRSRSLTGTGHHRSGSEVFNCQVDMHISTSNNVVNSQK